MNTTTPRLLDPKFRYVDSTKTDIRELFRRVGWTPPSEQKKQEQANKEAA